MPRIQSMRWRIASAYLALLIATLTILVGISLLQLRATYLRTLEAGVVGQAHLLATFTAPELQHPIDTQALAQVVRDAAERLHARVTIIATDGTVLADSLQPPGDNVLARPEVAAALGGEQGSDERQSSATGDDRLYVAVPVLGPPGAIGVVRIGVALSTIVEAQTQLGIVVLVTALGAGMVTVALAIVIARRMTQPVRDLRVMVGHVAAGDLQVQVPIPSDTELAALAQDFNQMAQRLRHVEQSRRTLLSNITHDLRTPLTSLQAIIETLQGGALEERDTALDFLRRMADEVDGMTRLVNEVLELARIESGELTLYQSPTDLCVVLRGAAARMQAQSIKAGVHIMLDLPAELPQTFLDAIRIEQAILNVLQNAVTFTPPDGTITLGARQTDPGIELWVQDTGIGIAPEHLPYIFERIYKADRSRTSPGTGLGLAIVKHLIERHGGSVRAESQPHRGTTIRMLLPAGLIVERENTAPSQSP